MTRPERCIVCAKLLHGGEQMVLVRGRRRETYCSEVCLRANVRKRRIASARVRSRWVLRALLAAAVFVGGNLLWHRYHAPPRQSLSHAWPDVHPEPPPRPAPIYFGPAWPPTDQDWTFAFDGATWTYPLPGPARQAPTIDGRIFGPEPPRDRPAQCRTPGRCGVDLGGALWGEHVYAALDGVVDRVQHAGQHAGNDGRGGQYVRLAHFGGMVFTQYFHLAATPRGLARGVRVRAGDVIGLLGDTGITDTGITDPNGGGRHLTFALSVRPSGDFPEVYWDPAPLMARWPLHLPPHGTVAGFAPASRDTDGH